MKLAIQTLAFIQSLVFLSQVIVIFVQYRVNRAYHEIRWWLLGSTLMAVGVIFMPMVTVKSMEMFARVANPLVVLGQIFLYIGVVKFINKKNERWIPIAIYAIYILFYYYYMYANNDISARTVVISTTLATISLMTAYQLFYKRDRLISSSANFTATVFLAYGCYCILRTFLTLVLPPIQSYSDQPTILIIAFITPTIASILWIFGLVIMLNQRLNIEVVESEEKYRSILNASPDDITITDLEGHILMVSPASKKMFGYEPDYEGFIGMRLTDFIVPEDIERAKSNIAQMYPGDYPRPNEYHGVRKDQSIFNIEVNSGFVSSSNGQPTKMVFIIRDISERKLAELKIQQLVEQLENERNTAQLSSITDSLTGLANRRYFDEALKTEFYRLKRSGLILSLILLDVDYFKKFNDNYGHLAGDECLRQLGNIFETIVGRVPDIVARYGGEEFVIILPETDENGAKVLAQRIQKAVEELAIPHSASDIAEYVTVSIGVVTVHTTWLTSPEQVVKLADEALYNAKKGGRNRIGVANENTKLGNNKFMTGSMT